MKARRKARGLALQALYELDCTTHPLEQVIRARLDDATLSDDGETFVFALVNGVIAHSAELDTLIQKYAPEWLSTKWQSLIKLCCGSPSGNSPSAAPRR